MNKFISALVATTAIVSVSTAYAATEKVDSESNVKMKKNGGYESVVKSEQTTSTGTAKQDETNVDVDVKDDGRMDKTITKESSTDPKGLGNKKTKSSETEFTDKKNGGYKQVTTTQRMDAADTNMTLVTTTDVDVDDAGNVTTTAKTEKTVDPKGLMNKKTTSSETKTVNGRVVKSERK